jgi:hypothetical protein
VEIVIPAKTNAETLVTNPDKANRSTIARTTPSVTATTVTAAKSSRLVRLLRDQALRSLSFDTFTRSHLQFSCVNTNPIPGGRSSPYTPFSTGVVKARSSAMSSGRPGALLRPAPLRTGYVEFHINGCMSLARLCGRPACRSGISLVV